MMKKYIYVRPHGKSRYNIIIAKVEGGNIRKDYNRMTGEGLIKQMRRSDKVFMYVMIRNKILNRL